VFVNVTEPVGAGFVKGLARPAGNATGFLLFEYAISTKWIELLKEIAPRAKRVAVLHNPALAAGRGQLEAIGSATRAFGLELQPLDVRDIADMERAVAEFARVENSGLVVTASTFADRHRELIIRIAARHRLPAVYPFRYYVTGGGLVSYGPNLVDPYRRAAGYVDRILRGEKPADLPVQAPTTYGLAINLKAAQSLGLTVPPTLLARADEVIE
jgi:putative ABC transport system substrate-binding protein